MAGSAVRTWPLARRGLAAPLMLLQLLLAAAALQLSSAYRVPLDGAVTLPGPDDATAKAPSLPKPPASARLPTGWPRGQQQQQAPQQPGSGAQDQEQLLPQCQFSKSAKRCYLHPYRPLAYAALKEVRDPAARFELQQMARGFDCWQQRDASSCWARSSSGCSWLGGGGGPAAELWRGLGRPCVLDASTLQAASRDFYVCPGSRAERYIICAAAGTQSDCSSSPVGCSWSQATAETSDRLKYILGAINDTLSWSSARPIAALPLGTHCLPNDVRIEDGDAATAPDSLESRLWGDCPAARRLGAGAGDCDARAHPEACPPLEAADSPFGNYDAFVYARMLHRTRHLLGGDAWARRYVAEFWACDAAGSDETACNGGGSGAATAAAAAAPLVCLADFEKAGQEIPLNARPAAVTAAAGAGAAAAGGRREATGGTSGRAALGPTAPAPGAPGAPAPCKSKSAAPAAPASAPPAPAAPATAAPAPAPLAPAAPTAVSSTPKGNTGSGAAAAPASGRGATVVVSSTGDSLLNFQLTVTIGGRRLRLFGWR